MEIFMKQQEMEVIVRRVLNELGTGVAMSLKLATGLIAQTEAKAQELGVHAVIAVSDASGRPVAVHCMDGAYIGSYDVALNKTYTAVAFQMPTDRLAALAAPGGELYGIQNTNDGKIVIFGGGEPLYLGDVMIGAIGVSGGTAEQDTMLGRYAKNKLKDVIAWK